MSIPKYDYNQTADREAITQLINRLRSSAGGGSAEVSDAAHQIIEDVKVHGDEAIVKYMRMWTNPDFEAAQIRVTADEMQKAYESLDPKLIEAMQASIGHIRAYESHIKPKDSEPIEIDGAQLSIRFTPIERVGLHVPGGRASYPSTAMMLSVPAQVAGCSEVAMVSPPPTIRPGESAENCDISPLVLGVCHMLEVGEVYRIGGAQAVAALAYGTETVKAVDHIVGPGNAYTQEAKRKVFGQVGIDGFFGPSEGIVIADETCNPAWVASDLLAQAEHDPGSCFLLSTSQKVIDDVVSAIEMQLVQRKRQDAITSALKAWSAAIVLPDESSLLEVADEIAGEHVILAVTEPYDMLGKLKNGGAFFLGNGTPIAAGDYHTGPNHSLPTGTTARFNSGLSVYGFMKRSSVEYYPDGPNDMAIEHIATLAEAEGLEAHAESLRIRKTK